MGIAQQVPVATDSELQAQSSSANLCCSVAAKPPPPHLPTPTLGIRCATMEPLAGQMDKLNPTPQRLGRPLDIQPFVSEATPQHIRRISPNDWVPLDVLGLFGLRGIRAHARYDQLGALGTPYRASTHLDTPLPPRANNQGHMAQPSHSRRLVFAGGSPASPQTAQQVGREGSFFISSKNGNDTQPHGSRATLAGKGVQGKETR
ncbi:hypothetical protein MAPG_07637 [Magnaporthiopsis poae ATCC 64411]|uniref:Uncharacterized protein n=1 Tax=Magnaporthiopsis poae (strain ATCC 64411 / 73-15) TaxID=644358 RepID=A0A0C4E572_MAGP6|nr:hypothetical protein MAPG_07637 [Magnaporthiopsis poae ATCC 64411]